MKHVWINNKYFEIQRRYKQHEKETKQKKMKILETKVLSKITGLAEYLQTNKAEGWPFNGQGDSNMNSKNKKRIRALLEQ